MGLFNKLTKSRSRKSSKDVMDNDSNDGEQKLDVQGSVHDNDEGGELPSGEDHSATSAEATITAGEVTPRELGEKEQDPFRTDSATNVTDALPPSAEEATGATEESVSNFQQRKSNTDTAILLAEARNKDDDDADRELEEKVTMLQSQIRRRQAQHQRRVASGLREAEKFPNKKWVSVRDIGGGEFYYWPSTGAITFEPPTPSGESPPSSPAEQVDETSAPPSNAEIDEDSFGDEFSLGLGLEEAGINQRASHFLASPVNSRATAFLFGDVELDIGDDMLEDDELCITPEQQHEPETTNVADSFQEPSIGDDAAAPLHMDIEAATNDDEHPHDVNQSRNEPSHLGYLTASVSQSAASMASNGTHRDEPRSVYTADQSESKHEHAMDQKSEDDDPPVIEQHQPNATQPDTTESRTPTTTPTRERMSNPSPSIPRPISLSSGSPSHRPQATGAPLPSTSCPRRIIAESATTRREKRPAMIVSLDVDSPQVDALESAKQQLASKMGLASPSDIAELVLQPYNAVVEHAWELQNGDRVLVRTYRDIINETRAASKRGLSDEDSHASLPPKLSGRTVLSSADEQRRSDTPEHDSTVLPSSRSSRSNNNDEGDQATHERAPTDENVVADPCSAVVLECPQPCPVPFYVRSAVFDTLKEISCRVKAASASSSSSSTSGSAPAGFQCFDSVKAQTIVSQLRDHVNPGRLMQIGTFIRVLRSIGILTASGNLRLIFDAIDTNNDGALTLEEFEFALYAWQHTVLESSRQSGCNTSTTTKPTRLRQISGVHAAASTLARRNPATPFCSTVRAEESYHLLRMRMPKQKVERLTRARDGASSRLDSNSLRHHRQGRGRPKSAPSRPASLPSYVQQQQHGHLDGIEPLQVPPQLGQYELEEWLRGKVLSSRCKSYQRAEALVLLAEFLIQSDDANNWMPEDIGSGQWTGGSSRRRRNTNGAEAAGSITPNGEQLLDGFNETRMGWDDDDAQSSNESRGSNVADSMDDAVPTVEELRAVAAWETAKKYLLEARGVIEHLATHEVARSGSSSQSRLGRQTLGGRCTLTSGGGGGGVQDFLDRDDRRRSQAASIESMRVRIAALLARVFQQLSEPEKAATMLAEATPTSSSSVGRTSSGIGSGTDGRNKTSHNQTSAAASIATSNASAAFAIAQHAMARSAALLRRATEAETPVDRTALSRFDAIASNNLLDAIALDPQHTPALLAFAQLLQERGDTLSAAVYFRRAAGLAKAPGDRQLLKSATPSLTCSRHGHDDSASALSNRQVNAQVALLPLAHKQARVTALYQYALLLSDKSEDHTAAIELLTKCVRMDSMHADAFYALGRITCQKLRKPSESIKWLRKAIAAQPRHADAMFALAQVLGQPNASHKTLQEAEAMYRGALSGLAEELDPSQASSAGQGGNTSGVGRSRGGGGGVSSSKGPDKARKQLQLVLQAFAKFMQVARGDDTEARRLLEMAHHVDPAQGGATQSLGLFLQNKGMHDKAADVFTEAVGKNPRNVDAHVGLARSMMARGNHTRAREALMHAVSLDGNNGDALWALAELEWQAGLVERAQGYFERACGQQVQSPTDFNAAYGSFLFEALGHFEKAAERLRAALRMDNDHGPALCSYAWMMFKVNEDVGSAIRMLKRAVRSAPHHLPSLIRLAKLLALPFIRGRRFVVEPSSASQRPDARRGSEVGAEEGSDDRVTRRNMADLATAVELLETALRQAPENTAVLVQSAMVLVVSGGRSGGDLCRAVKQLKRANKLTPNDGEVQYLLGVALQQRAHELLGLAKRGGGVRESASALRRRAECEKGAASCLRESVDALKRAIRLLPGHVLAMYCLATQAEAMDQLKLTQRVLLAALNVDPEDCPQDDDFVTLLIRLRLAYYRAEMNFLHSPATTQVDSNTNSNSSTMSSQSASLRRALVVHQRIMKRASTMALAGKQAMEEEASGGGGGGATATGGTTGKSAWADTKESRFLRAFRQAAP